MNTEKYDLNINPHTINENIALYKSVTRTLFDESQMHYTVHNFYSLVGNTDISFNRNTFYNNTSSFEKEYRNFLYKRCDEKTSLSSDMYYVRLESYLLSAKKIYALDHSKGADGKKFLDNLLVTENFFPLYISLICSHSKKTNWKQMYSRIKKLYKKFFTTYGTDQQNEDFGDLNYNQADRLYSHWLALVFPLKLYKLICKIDNVLFKEQGYPTHMALKYNLGLFIDQVAKASFPCSVLQNKFLDYANFIFDEFSRNRKKGISYSDDSSKETMKVYTSDNLLLKLDSFLKKLNNVLTTEMPITKTEKE